MTTELDTPEAPPFPELLTPRLRLRELVAADAGALFAIHGDRDAMRWFGVDPPGSAEDSARLIEVFAGWRRHANPGTRWGLESRVDGRLLGSCGLFSWNRAWSRCSLGYELAREEWGRGLMREALGALLDWGFADAGMALNRIEAMVHPDNAASLRLLERLGFRPEGRLRQAAFWGGRFEDMLLLSRLRSEHQSSTQAP